MRMHINSTKPNTVDGPSRLDAISNRYFYAYLAVILTVAFTLRFVLRFHSGSADFWENGYTFFLTWRRILRMAMDLHSQVVRRRHSVYRFIRYSWRR